jgi:hypothetical protein
MTIDDDTIRAQVGLLLHQAFAQLNAHTHGDIIQGRSLAEIQGHIAAAVRKLTELDEALA